MKPSESNSSTSKKKYPGCRVLERILINESIDFIPFTSFQLLDSRLLICEKEREIGMEWQVTSRTQSEQAKF